MKFYRFLATIIYWWRQHQGALRRYPSDMIDEAVTDFFWRFFRNAGDELRGSGIEAHRHGQMSGPAPQAAGLHSEE